MAADFTSRLAVLIDADNTSPKIADGLFDEIAKIGEASVRRIYGDFASPRMKGWTEILARHAIVPQQQFAYTSGKNASDITLVIDAMDLLHTGRFGGFCLVSSDSDFTRLASRIREQGVDVFGFGERKTPESFRQACRRFVYTENLVAPVASATAPGAPAPAALEPLSAARTLLTRVLEQSDTDDGWLSLGAVGTQLANIAPDFDPRSFGVAKLSDLARRAGGFELAQSPGGAMRVRITPAPAAKTASTAKTASSGKSAPATKSADVDEAEGLKRTVARSAAAAKQPAKPAAKPAAAKPAAPRKPAPKAG